jgi:hypothetical protein
MSRGMLDVSLNIALSCSVSFMASPPDSMRFHVTLSSFSRAYIVRVYRGARSMQTEDGSIIQECINGEPGAFGVLVDKYKEGIYAFVYSKLQDFQDAEDVTQEVFLRAYRGLRGLRRWESFAF